MTQPLLPPPGTCAQLAPGLRMVRAADASAMRGPGTNSYLLGTGNVTLIDPGPDDPAHLTALLAALHPSERIGQIIVTHRHHDHTGLAATLRTATKAPVLAYATPAPTALPDWARTAHPGGAEGIDHGFAPDATLADGQVIDAGGITAQIVHTPGHLDDHICIAWGAAAPKAEAVSGRAITHGAGQGGVLTADHVMGWSTSLISPPEGSMAAYMASLRRLQPLAGVPFYPGHGAPIRDPAQRLADLIAHRHGREAAILAALATPANVVGIVARVYTDLAPHLRDAAARNVLAHLIDLAQRGRVVARPNGQLALAG